MQRVRWNSYSKVRDTVVRGVGNGCKYGKGGQLRGRTRSVRFSHFGVEDDWAGNDNACRVGPEPGGYVPRVMETTLIRSKSEPSVTVNLV